MGSRTRGEYINMMQQKIAPTQATVSNFIIAIRSGSVEEVKRYLDEYTNDLVNKLEIQSRQPSLYFSVLIPDHAKSYEITKMLIEHGANPNFKDQYIQTVLFYICREGKENCFDLLLASNVPVDEQDVYGQTPLYYIARENRLSLLPKIIDRVNVNHVDRITNQTALFYSAREGHLEMCKMLIEHGCDVTQQDSTHKTAAFYAKKYGKNQVFEYLTNELQKVKELKKMSAQPHHESKSKEEDKKLKKKKPVDVPVTKVQYKLVRMDAKGSASEFSEADFLEWVKDYPEIQLMLRNPDEIEADKIEQVKNQDGFDKVAMRVLNICWKIKGAYLFHDPVDPRKFNINDYFDIVKNPMDFGTVRKKLTHNVYNNAKEFVEDMLLVFANCVLYNGNESDVGKISLDIRRQFEELARSNGLLNE